MIIFRYLAKEVYGTLLASVLILLVLLISNQFVHYLAKAAAGVMPLRTVIKIVSLQMPLLLPLLLPLSLYVGILMGYGRLYADGEMTILYACGFSKKRLIGISLCFSLLVSLLVAVLTFWLQPLIESYKLKILTDAATSSPLERMFPDQFITIPGKNLVFYTQGLSRDHRHLKDIFVATHSASLQKNEKNAAWNIVVADEGHQTIDLNTRDRFLMLENGYRYVGTPGAANFQVIQYKTYGVRIEKNAIPIIKRMESMDMIDLWQQRHTNPNFQIEIQWRIAFPISVFILTLLAVSFTKADPRQGRYVQLFPAFLLYILYVNLLFVSLTCLEKKQIPLSIGLWWVHGVMLIVAFILLCRFMEWRFKINFF